MYTERVLSLFLCSHTKPVFLFLFLSIECLTAIPADLVFLIEDFSRAQQSNFQQVVSFLKTTIRSLSVHPDVMRVGLVFYSEEPWLEFSLDAFQNRVKILEHLDKLTHRGRAGQTKTGVALGFLRNEVFIQEKGSRSQQGVQQVVVVIMAGSSQDNVSRPASLLHKAGMTIYAVGSQLALESTDLEKIASYPPWKHVILLESFLQLAVVGSKIKNQLCPELVGRRAFVSGMGFALQEGRNTFSKNLISLKSLFAPVTHLLYPPSKKRLWSQFIKKQKQDL